MRTRICVGTTILLCLLCHEASTAQVGTAFTYNGHLRSDGQIVNGFYDFKFSLFDATNAGSQIGNTLDHPGVLVTNGVFTEILDLGPGVFSGSAYWLEIAVRSNGNSSAYTTLAPRQPLTPAPYAIYADRAATATGLALGVVTGASIATGQVVKTINGLTDQVSLTAGSNIALTVQNNTVRLDSTVAAGPPGPQGPQGSPGSADAWSRTGNSGTITGPNFLGTIDNQALEFRVNSNRVLRLEPQSRIGISGIIEIAPNLIGGSHSNEISAGVIGASIAGGGTVQVFPGLLPHSRQNRVTGDFGTIGGGTANTAGSYSTIAGGDSNLAESYGAFIGGGEENVIGGGGYYATIPGGSQNIANAPYSFAAGYQASASHQGAFVWADSIDANFASTAVDQFSVRANGGVRLVTGGAGMTLDGAPVLSGQVGTSGLADASVTRAKIGSGQVVKSLNGLTDTLTIAGGSNVTVTAGGGILTIGARSGWELGGNNGTTVDQNFIGTTDTQPLEIKVNSKRVFRLESKSSPDLFGNHTNVAPNIIGGSPSNHVAASAIGATIAGGGYYFLNEFGNIIGADQNSVWDSFGTVGGGAGNSAGYSATVAGGANNSATDLMGTVGGGSGNLAGAPGATISGGEGNIIETTGVDATIPGGSQNLASAAYSFAAGNQANAFHTGAFVWADSTDAAFASTGSDQFCIRATGGVQLHPGTSLYCGSQTRQMLNLWGSLYGIGVQGNALYLRSNSDFSWFKGGVHNDNRNNPGTGGTELMRLDNNGNLRTLTGTIAALSDRNAKTNFAKVDAKRILQRVAALPIETWNYKTADPSERHIGPMAQDFQAAFEVGLDNKSICTVDADGVALAAIQGLNQIVGEDEARIERQNTEIKDLQKRLTDLEKLVSQLSAR